MIIKPVSDTRQGSDPLSGTWPEVRVCMVCGYVGRCDASNSAHILKDMNQVLRRRSPARSARVSTFPNPSRHCIESSAALILTPNEQESS